jgi:hypothetical protein
MIMLINRNYAHREYGAIGAVELEVPEGEWKLDGKVLPESSVAALAKFALQILQDAYAGAKSTDEAQANFDKKRLKLATGNLGLRASNGETESERVTRQIVRDAFKAKVGKDSPEWKDFDALGKDEQAAKLDAMFAKNAKALQPAVDAKLKTLADERARKAAIRADFQL